MMRSKLEDSEFAPLYAVRREYEELRRGLARGLAKWTEGAVEFEAIFPAVEAFEAGHRKLLETIYSHRDIRRAVRDAAAREEVRAPPEASSSCGQRT